MFVFSVNSKTVKYAAFVGVIVLLTGIGATVSKVQLKNVQLKSVSSSGDTVNFKASDNAERLKFISQFGWEVDEEPDEVTEIIIPIEFDDVYNNYNEIQLKQDCDLTDYCGKRVKRFTYIIKNYPGYSPDDTCVRINLLVYNDVVIGGDVSSTELSGFMHTFSKKF